MRKVYLSGPMTGFEDWNYPAFHEAAKKLRKKGYEVYNPAEFTDDPDNFDARAAFSEYCDYIINHADLVVILPCWFYSKGVKVEKTLAEIIGLEIVFYEDMEL